MRYFYNEELHKLVIMSVKEKRYFKIVLKRNNIEKIPDEEKCRYYSNPAAWKTNYKYITTAYLEISKEEAIRLYELYKQEE